MSAKQYGMVIDLDACVGCAACDIACKAENNVPNGFAWSNHIIETTGIFPKVKFRYVPTLCNHCTNAPCVKACPTTAMHKDHDTGLVLHDTEKCIGCSACRVACPYGVIFLNYEQPHAEYRSEEEAIPGCTSSGKETTDKLGVPIPTYNPSRGEGTMAAVRPRGVVEKCTFCNHRLARGELPACVSACPAEARIFGDLNDKDSAPRKVLEKKQPQVLQKEKGTRPNVLYVGKYNA